MTTRTFDFGQLIDPISSSVFLEEYWKKQALHIARHTQDYYSSLFSLQDLDHLMQFHRLKYPLINPITNRSEWLDLLEGMNTSSLESYGVPDLFRLYRNYIQGDTFICHRLHQYLPEMAKLCHSIAGFFTHPVSSHLFFTHKDSNVCLPHYDLDEIFVLQLEGGKLWQLYNTTAVTPDLYWQPAANEPLPTPEQEIYLEAGDMLYVPAGCVHGVKTVSESSVHLTIGVLPFTGVDLLKSAIASVQDHSAFSEALPIDWLSSPGEMQEKLINLIRKLPQQVQLKSAIAPLAQHFLDELPPQDSFSDQNLKLEVEIAKYLELLEKS